MNRVHFAWCLFLILPFTVMGQVTWLSGEDLDLGAVHRGVETEAIFTLRNDGNSPIRIEQIRTACSCTAPDWEATPILPGETRDVRVTWQPSRRGAARQRLTVFFYGIRKPVKLYLRAEVP